MIHHRKYDNFRKDQFRKELNDELLNLNVNNDELSEFDKTFMSLFHKDTPKGHNFIRANNANFTKKKSVENWYVKIKIN